jgi:hypothetical protein
VSYTCGDQASVYTSDAFARLFLSAHEVHEAVRTYQQPPYMAFVR